MYLFVDLNKVKLFAATRVFSVVDVGQSGVIFSGFLCFSLGGC